MCKVNCRNANGGKTRKREFVFAVNGERFELPHVDPSTTLLRFLRSGLVSSSRKLGCGDGGCGACVVLVSKYDPNIKRLKISALNGCSITTTEGFWNTRDGFHSIHERFAGFHASQCGFCTPGMCMSLFSAIVNAYKGNKPDPPPGFSKLTSSEAEKAIAGNLCRCTGYQPIADACLTFASDSKEMKMSKLPPYDPTKNISTYPEFLKSYYKENQRYDHYVDLTYVPELSIIEREQRGIEVGATVTISKFISFLKEDGKINVGSYGKLKIASPFVRNSAGVGRNLVMAQKNGFPSDVSTLFLGLCATVSMMTNHGLEKLTWEELLSSPPLDLRTVLLSVCIPFKKDRINVAFQADVSPCKSSFLLNDIQLVFGAYDTTQATRAKKVEEYLTGKILNVHVLHEALKFVKLAVVPEDGTLHPEYRSSLAVSYVFEFIYPFTDAYSVISGGLLNGINKISVEEYYPVGEPMKKVGAAMQAAGEAVYVDDIPSLPNCLHGAFIYSTKPLAGVKGIQLESNRTDGVTDFITFKDIPSGGQI
ncbi:unnamed protein product [Withania somnifera]